MKKMLLQRKSSKKAEAPKDEAPAPAEEEAPVDQDPLEEDLPF